MAINHQLLHMHRDGCTLWRVARLHRLALRAAFTTPLPLAACHWPSRATLHEAIVPCGPPWPSALAQSMYKERDSVVRGMRKQNPAWANVPAKDFEFAFKIRVSTAAALSAIACAGGPLPLLV